MGQVLFFAGLPSHVCKCFYSFLLYSSVDQCFSPGTDFATQGIFGSVCRNLGMGAPLASGG